MIHKASGALKLVSPRPRIGDPSPVLGSVEIWAGVTSETGPAQRPVKTPADSVGRHTATPRVGGILAPISPTRHVLRHADSSADHRRCATGSTGYGAVSTGRIRRLPRQNGLDLMQRVTDEDHRCQPVLPIGDECHTTLGIDVGKLPRTIMSHRPCRAD
jgi:hypothetical protein